MNNNKLLTNYYKNYQLPKREIDLIVCHVLEISTAQLMIFDSEISQKDDKTIQKYLKQRQAGKPFAYIVGSKPFWTLDLIVNNHTLIPRPETELLVETVLAKTQADFNGTILDLGTGTGAIALSIASERPNAKITAIDFSQECVDVAIKNKLKQDINNVEIFASNWFEEFQAQQFFDFIVANPPYIQEHDKHLEQLSYEPITALTAKQNGLADIYYIIKQAKKHLKHNAWLMLEHGYNQQHEIQQFLRKNCYKNIKTLEDLAQIPRITIAQWQNLAISTQ